MMRFRKNSIVVPISAIVPGVVMSSSTFAMGISIGESELSDDRLTPICNYLITAQNSVDLENIAAAQDRLVQAQVRVANAREQLAKEPEILDRIRPVVEQGAVAELQLNRPEQQVLSAQDTVIAAQSDMASALERVTDLGASSAGQATRAKIAALMEVAGLCQDESGSS